MPNIFSGKVSQQKNSPQNILPRMTTPPFVSGNVSRETNLSNPLQEIIGGRLNLPSIPTNFGEVQIPSGESILERLLNFIKPEEKVTAPGNITVNITIEGNADEQTMRTAGQQMAFDLQREFENFFSRQQHEKQRTTF